MPEITIYKTKTMKEAAERIVDVLSRVDKTRLDVMHTVIVPDRASLEAERVLLKALGGSFNVQVRTFRRLAADVLPKYEYLSKQAGVMALSGIISDCKDSLGCFTKGVETSGFAESIYDTVSMMKYCRVTPKMLLGKFPKSVDGKAKDIALIYGAYLDFTRDRFIDSADKLNLLCDAIKQTDFAENSFFYFYDFDNFSAQELALVEELTLKSLGVTVACCASDDKRDARLYLNDIFSGVMSVCAKHGIVPNVQCDEPRYVNRYARKIGENLFRYGNVEPIEAGDFAEIREGATRFDEVYELACKIRRYVRQGDDRRFRDVYVVTSDVAKYSNAISTVFADFGIPYFCDRQYALSAHPYSRFVLDYLSLCRNNGKLASVLPFVKNPFFAQDDEDGVYFFENYCLKYNVSYRYDNFDLGKDDIFYDKAKSFAKRFNKLFGTLKAPNSATVGEYVQFVRELIDKTELNEKNASLSESQRQRGMEFESKVTAQAAEKFGGVLTQAERVMGARYVKSEEFIKLLTTGLAAVKISVIPVYNDCVIFANMAKARKHDVKFLALLGANQGAMPIVKSDTKLLSDRNIKDLAEGGVDVEPQILTENRRERFSLFQLLMEPTEKLYVSYAASDGVDKLMPSPFVKELGRLFCVGGKPLEASAATDEDVYTEKQAQAKLVLNARKLQDHRHVDVPSFDALFALYGDRFVGHEGNAGKNLFVPRGAELFFKKSNTSVSQLTDFFKCPYRFYIEYGLNVKPRTVSELQSADLGNVLHEVLETYVRDMDLDETDEETTQKAEEKFDKALSDDFYRGLRNDVKMSGTLSQLKAECVRMCKVVKKQFIDSDFVNYATELSFGDKDGLPPVVVNFDGGFFNLVGKIDRLDVCGNRFIVIDYKSGVAASRYGEKELYVGHKMQLPVYVRAAQDLTGKRPAGFYYFNMHDSFAPMDADEDYVYNGRTLNDPDVAKQIDRKLAEGSSKKLGLALKDSGSFDLRRGAAKLLTDEQFDSQTQYTFELIRRAGNLMRQGYAAVNPYEGVCSYCDYKPICDFGDTLTYNPRKVTDEVDKTDIERMVQK